MSPYFKLGSFRNLEEFFSQDKSNAGHDGSRLLRVGRTSGYTESWSLWVNADSTCASNAGHDGSRLLRVGRTSGYTESWSLWVNADSPGLKCLYRFASIKLRMRTPAPQMLARAPLECILNVLNSLTHPPLRQLSRLSD